MLSGSWFLSEGGGRFAWIETLVLLGYIDRKSCQDTTLFLGCLLETTTPFSLTLIRTYFLKLAETQGFFARLLERQAGGCEHVKRQEMDVARAHT